MGDQSDQTRAFLEGWHRGDRGALEKLLERDLPWLHEHVRKRLGDGLRRKMESGDFVQEVVIDVLRYGPRFVVSSEAQFRALMARIVENNLRDQNRRIRAGKRDVAKERALPGDTVLDLDPPVRTSTTPSRAFDRAQYQEWVRLAMQLLDGDDHYLIREREWEQRSFQEIGADLGVTDRFRTAS